MRTVSFQGSAFLLALGFLSPSAFSEDRIVKVGVYENSPKVFTDESGKPSGIFIDILEHIAHEEGWSLEYVPGTWEEGLQRLAAGDIDLMPDVAFNAHRARRYRFNHIPVLSSWSQVYAREGSDIHSILDLEGKRVAVLSGSVQQEAFAELAKGFDLRIHIEPRSDYAAAFQAVKDGAADAAIANNYFGFQNARKFRLQDTAVIFHPAQLHFAAPREGAGALLDTLDRHLQSLKENPRSEYYRSLDRWMSRKTGFVLPPWVKAAGVLAGLVILMFLTGSIVLKRQVNARTRDLSRRNEQMAAIDKALRSTTTQLHLQSILESALQAALNLTRIESGILCLVDGKNGRLVPRAMVVDGSGVAAPGSARDQIIEDSIGSPESWTGRSRILRERSAAESAAGDGSWPGENARYLAAFPLRVRNHAIGVLCLFSNRDEKPENDFLDLVEDVCAPLALAIENALLFEEAKNHEAELEKQVAERTRELAQAMERALAADRIKSAFLATMSHELRTPLNAIIGFTGILLKELAGPLNEEQQKQMTMVQTSSRHLLSLINDVLDISKIEAGQLELAVASFDLASSIEKMTAMVSPQAGKKGVEMNVDIADDVGETTADQRRIEQIMLNLLNNAVKFTDQGHVRVSCGRNGDAYVFSVSDTGIGIGDEDRQGLFQPFHQVDSGIARKREGTGLGLSICKKLLDMMGGDIQLESRPGHGSTFTVRFPCHAGGDG